MPLRVEHLAAAPVSLQPQRRRTDRPGSVFTATGEAYSMANLDGRLYIASYPGAVLSVYDTSQGYRFGSEPGANPRDLGRIDDLSYRPRSTLAGPGDRVWTASIPDYGRWGGPLSWYDPQSGEKKAYYQICGDGSCYTLAWLQDQELIAVGTTIAGGSGTQPKVDQAVLFLWDYHREEKVWEGSLDRPISAFNSLHVGADNRLYGTAIGDQGATLFVFDPRDLSFCQASALPSGGPLDLGLQNGPNGFIYGFTKDCIYRFTTDRLIPEEIIRRPGEFSVAGPILGNRIYSAYNHRLLADQLS